MRKKIARKMAMAVIGSVKYVPFTPALKLRNFCYRFALKGMGDGCNIADAVTIIDPSRTSLGKRVSIHEYSVIGGKGEVTIGDYVAIGSHCHIVSDAHNFSRKDVLIKEQGVSEEPVIIGSNVWIGTQVTILGNVRIGDGAVIGAGSVVTKDVPGNVIAFGVPCKVVRSR